VRPVLLASPHPPLRGDLSPRGRGGVGGANGDECDGERVSFAPSGRRWPEGPDEGEAPDAKSRSFPGLDPEAIGGLHPAGRLVGPGVAAGEEWWGKRWG